MFWDNYVNLCNKKGISPTAAAVEIGFSVAAPTGWKKGALPRDTALRKIAAYFGVSVEDLLNDEKPAPKGDGLTGAQRELLRLIPEMSEAEAAVLLAAARAQVEARRSRDSRL